MEEGRTIPDYKNTPHCSKLTIWNPERIFHVFVYTSMSIAILILEYAFGAENRGIGESEASQLIAIVIG